MTEDTRHVVYEMLHESARSRTMDAQEPMLPGSSLSSHNELNPARPLRQKHA